ncbi:MAG: PilZ domain-containing protein [Sphingomonas sp.]
MADPDDVGGDNRDSARASFRIAATLRDRRSNKFEVHLVDLSTSGFQAEAHPSLDPGAIVWLVIPGMEGLEATVMWRKRAVIGCKFNQSLHPAVFDHLVQRQS